MDILTTKAEAQRFQKQHHREERSIGFVPTMGALHEGHIELVKRSIAENQVTVASIFVNPTQFDNPEDLQKYPRTLEADCALLKAAGCDAVFAPSAEEMYDEPPKLTLDFGNIERIMEGKYRKGHFNGVGIVVSKLFHIISPDKAYFGLKDLQQVAVVERLVKDLSFTVDIVPCPTVREADGLAMSSRNRRLSSGGREIAFNVYLSLQIAKETLLNGGTIANARNAVDNHFKSLPEFSLQYLDFVDYNRFELIDTYDPHRRTAICTANYLEDVRLIDNIVF